MSLKIIIPALVQLSKNVPLIVFMTVIIVIETGYLLIDQYVLDLTPSAHINHFNDRLDAIEKKIDFLNCAESTIGSSDAPSPLIPEVEQEPFILKRVEVLPKKIKES